MATYPNTLAVKVTLMTSAYKAGMCKEKSCPAFCLGVESLFCLGPSISTTRLFIMDKYDLRPDPFDNQIVRFEKLLGNCIQCFAYIQFVFP